IYISSTQAHLPAAREEGDMRPVLFLLFPPNIRRAVRRSVIDHKHTQTVLQRHDGIDHRPDVLLLLVGRYDDELVCQSVGLARKYRRIRTVASGPPGARRPFYPTPPTSPGRPARYRLHWAWRNNLRLSRTPVGG